MVHTVNTTHSQVGSGHAVSGGTATNTSVNQAIAAVPTSVTGLTINLNIGFQEFKYKAKSMHESHRFLCFEFLLCPN